MPALSIQMTGVSVIQYYAPRIFESIGIDTSTTLGLQSGNSVIALIGEGLCIWFIDRLGRRGPFIWGNALSGLTFVIGTIIIAVFPAEANNHNAARTFVAMTWLVRRHLQRRSSHADRMYHCSSTWSSHRAAGLCLGRYVLAVPSAYRLAQKVLAQIPVEMFNSATRAKATAITSSAAWISNCMLASATLQYCTLTIISSHDRPAHPHRI